MPFEIKAVKRRFTYLRAFVSFNLVAAVQLMNPAAAADPASKIDPPHWSHTHSQEEVQAYRTHAHIQEPEKKTSQSVVQARLRRMLRPRPTERA
jgi:hypothetical protein